MENTDIGITRDSYRGGYNLLGFDVDPTTSPNFRYISMPHQGHTKLNLRFKSHLEDPVTLILYATFPETMEIDQTRNVKLAVKENYRKDQMNAKQLYIALASNPNTNTVFDGIYSIDTLKDIKNKPELIICNTDPSDKPGKHWALFFFDESNSVDFYDSLGKAITYYGPEFIDFVNKFAENYNQCIKKAQPINTSLCGQYCL